MKLTDIDGDRQALADPRGIGRAGPHRQVTELGTGGLLRRIVGRLYRVPAGLFLALAASGGGHQPGDAVPQRAVSMSIRQMLRSRHVVLSVPDARKAPAVRAAVEGEVSPNCPASVLQRHESCALYLDPPAASLLSQPDRHRAR